MARSQHTFTVAQPLDTVRAFVADPCHSADWDASVATITPDPADPAVWDLVVAFYGKRIPFRLVRGADDAGVVEFRGTNRSAVLLERFALAPTDGGTSVTYLADVRLTGALRLFNKGLDSAFAAITAKSAARLATALDMRTTTG